MGRLERNGSPSGDGRQNNGEQEIASRVELVRVADLDRDALALVRLYTQPTIIEHLASVAPSWTEDQVRDLFERNPNFHPLVAINPTGEIIGTVVVEEPVGRAIREAKISLLAVDEAHRRRGIARKMVRSGEALAFSTAEKDGLDCEQVMVAVIIGPEGYEIPIRLFTEDSRNRYNFHGSILTRRCDSWNMRLGRFVPRDVQQMIRQRADFLTHHRNNVDNIFPKSAISS